MDVLPPPPALPPGCAGSIVWQDNFNSGTALTADYTVTGTVTKTAAAGPDGSQACVIPDTFVSHRMRKDSLSFSGRSGCVSLDIKDNGDPVGWGILISNGASLIAEVYDTTANRVQIFTALNSATSAASGLWTNGTYFTARVQWTLSTYIGPAATNVALDGELSVYINGTLAVQLTGIKLYSYTPGTTAQSVVTT